MNSIGYEKHKSDEFECSECDYKCSSYIGIIEHSEIHQCPNDGTESSLSILLNANSTCKNDLNEKCTDIYSHETVIKREIEESSGLTDIPVFNYIENHEFEVKREKSLYEDISKAEIYQEGGLENENIKLEQIDIKHEILPDSPHQINEYDNIHHAQNTIGLNLTTSGDTNGRNVIHPTFDNVNKSNTYDSLSVRDGDDMSRSLSSECAPSQIDFDFTDSSQDLQPKKKICSRGGIEIEVDTTGINPPGWKCYIERVQTKKDVESAAILSVGSKFYTYDDLSRRLEKFQELEQVQLWVRDSRTIVAAAKRAKRKSLNPALKYAELTYSCVFGGRKPSDQTKTNNQTSAGGCPFKVRLSTSIDGKALVVKEICHDHNHEPGKKLHEEPRRVYKKNVKPTAKQTVKPTSVCNEVCSSSGTSSTTTNAKSRYEILEFIQQQYNQQQQQIQLQLQHLLMQKMQQHL